MSECSSKIADRHDGDTQQRAGAPMARPVIIGSERSEVGLPAGMDVLRRGGSALDAVEAAMRCCEDNLADHYVGTGGLPNARGEVELDASVMLGSSRRFGAVGAVRGYPNPISIARAVLERLPQHCLLVGAGAELFAEENGFTRAELLTDEARALWREQLTAAQQDSVEGENTAAVDGDHHYRAAALDLVRSLAPHEGPWGTINIIALDASGELCVGVSTSGYPFKYPGRVGDSAIPGAGNWCDLRAGAAACTGRGELSMRGGTARTVVDLLDAGREPADACREGLADVATLPDEFRAELRALALTPDGRHGGAAGQPGSVYAVMTPDSTEPELRPRAVL
jgi:beta-aspartyl-peptidase (threonine type)